MSSPTPLGRGSAKATSLRSRWNRGFAVLTTIIVLSVLTALMGSRLLVSRFRDSAVRVERSATNGATLRANVISHAIAVTSPTSDAQERQRNKVETTVRAGFVRAIADEDSGRAKALLEASSAEWQTIVDAAGPPGQRAERVAFGLLVSTRAPTVLALLDQAGAVGRADVRGDLADAARVERQAMAVLAILGLLAIVLALRLARRLTTEVLRPVRILRDSANHLATGELDHRVVIDRADELGQLAVSFNAMADAIAGSQRILTVEANHDSLTGLANGANFRARLQVALAAPVRRDRGQAVLFVDLDDFKDVNDTLGHAAGDELLRAVARRLLEAVRPADLVARLGGDEFALLLDDVGDPNLAFTVANRVVATLAEPVAIGGRSAHVGASVGLAMRTPDSTPEKLMRQADVAMYAAKSMGKHRVERYDAGLDELAVERQSLRNEVVQAAARGELVVDYQPVIDLDSGTLVGLEALVRWQHPTRGLLPPMSFIGPAEETGAIIGIGNWVLETAARQLQNWQRRYGLPKLWLSVNVSVCQLDKPGFAHDVESILRKTGLDPARLVLEITESVLADPDGGAAASLAALRLPGVRVALDDFGTGYSSLGYLSQLPVDVLKIDRSFVSGHDSGESGHALLEAIVGMGQRLGLDVIPEGIEELDQLSRLRAMGCHSGQGFLLGRPASPDVIETLLASPLPLPVIGLSDVVLTPQLVEDPAS
ncbi:MAG: hypothetical protein QOE35_2539 [Actinomycetota bacterium]|jgi:diguanylate cyclase (GGDEF)-like protein